MDYTKKYQEIQKKIAKLKEGKVRIETTLGSMESEKEALVNSILEQTKTETLEEARAKVDLIETKLSEIQVDIETVLKEVEDYEQSNK